MKITEVRELTDKELREKLDNTVEAQHKLKLQHAVSPLENPSQIRANRRDIARMKTVIRERELNK